MSGPTKEGHMATAPTSDPVVTEGTPPAADPTPPASSQPPGGAPVPAGGGKKQVEYLVFEATKVDADGLPIELKRVGGKKSHTADDSTGARWLAVDADAVLAKRTSGDAEGDPPKLLPIAVRLLTPTPTREQKIVKTNRT